VDQSKLSRKHRALELLRKSKKERDDLLSKTDIASDNLNVKIKKEHKYKKEKKDKKYKKEDYNYNKEKRCWLVPGIRVRVVSRSLHRGNYYRKKGIVNCVTDPRKGVCILDVADPQASLEDVSQRDLETALPKPNGKVKILRGTYHGLEGILLERNSKKDKAIVQLKDDMSVHKFPFDDVAEYVFTSHDD